MLTTLRSNTMAHRQPCGLGTALQNVFKPIWVLGKVVFKYVFLIENYSTVHSVRKVNLWGYKVNSLMSAGDIVLVSSSAAELQLLINNLEKYCGLWNLRVSLSKSREKVFSNGGRLHKNYKQWRYRNERVEVVEQKIQLRNDFYAVFIKDRLLKKLT